MLSRMLGRRLAGKLPLLPSFAAAMSFYFLVSLVPFLVVVSKTAAWLFSANLTPELADFLRDVLPPESRLRPEALVEAVQRGPRRGLGWASGVLGLWTATSGLNEMARSVHYLYSSPAKPSPGGWRRRAKAFGLLAIWTAALCAGAVAFVLVPALQGYLKAQGGGKLPFAALGGAVRYPIAFALVFAAFLSTYRYVPDEAPGRRAAAAGAGVAAGACAGVSLLFALLLPRVLHVSLFGGALGSAAAVLVWAYCCAWGVLLGGAVSARLDEA